jgi:hypothetical protein
MKQDNRQMKLVIVIILINFNKIHLIYIVSPYISFTTFIYKFISRPTFVLLFFYFWLILGFILAFYYLLLTSLVEDPSDLSNFRD